MRLLFFFLLTAAAWAGQLQGVVTFLDGGTGAGEVHLRAHGRVLRLHYRDGDYREAPGTSWEYGAIWRVRYQDDVLRSIEFVGFDTHVRDAVQGIRRYYRALAGKSWEEAYAELSPARQAQQSLSQFCSERETVRYSTSEVPSYAFKVVGNPGRTVTVLINEGYLVVRSDSYFRCTVVDGKLDRMETISRQEFEDA